MKPETESHRRPVVFVLPTALRGQQGPVAAWLNTAGWASAAIRLGHPAHIITRSGILNVNELRERAVTHTSPSSGPLAVAQRLPVPVKVLIKDLREWSRAYRFNRFVSAIDALPESCDFVWQRHELFHYAGSNLARRLAAPLVAYVTAAKVWEARSWGVTRPGWAGLVESFGERRFLESADLVACVSEEVAAAVIEMGVDSSRVIVTPSTVDTELFSPDGGKSLRIRSDLGLDDRFIIGWVGSFRSFHGLAVLIEAFAKVLATLPSALLLLVGDGPERSRVHSQVNELGMNSHVRFLGAMPQPELPAVIGIMDIAVVSGGVGGEPFHYSPLKLWEFLAMERPVIGPRVGPPSRMLTEGVDVILVDPGDATALAQAITNLAGNPGLREAIGRRGRSTAQANSWSRQFDRVREALPVTGNGPVGSL